MEFSYSEAFSRNIGWITEAEQEVLRNKRIAIAGMGGVGGSHLLTLTRLGVGAFNIADFDTFELANFNRQAGALVRNLGRPKVDVLAEMALEINPSLQIKTFNEGVIDGNVNDFLENVDLYVDGLDFFALGARRLVFSFCSDKHIPAVTSAPMGMGAALLNFLPRKMTFEEYFQLEGYDESEQLLRFLIGLSPRMLQRSYLIDQTAIKFADRQVPSTPMGCELCAGMAATQALKILLSRGHVLAVPWGLHFDAFRNKMIRTWRPGGNSNPLQRLEFWIAKHKFTKAVRSSLSMA